MSRLISPSRMYSAMPRRGIVMRYSAATGAAVLPGGATAGAVATAIEGEDTAATAGVAGRSDASGCALGIAAGSGATAIVSSVDGLADVAVTGADGTPATSRAASTAKGAKA